MIDLSGIARRLRLSVDQIRLAADLLQQGYQPTFLHRYRADEIGRLSPSVLWELKFEIDRQTRLQASREGAAQQLPQDAKLDQEAEKFLANATSDTDIETVLRCFRARRQFLNQERGEKVDKLLELLISSDKVTATDVVAWTEENLQVPHEEAEELVEHVKRSISAMLHGDTQLNLKLRRMIQQKAKIAVTEVEAKPEAATSPESEGDVPTDVSSDSPAEVPVEQSATDSKAEEESSQTETSQTSEAAVEVVESTESAGSASTSEDADPSPGPSVAAAAEQVVEPEATPVTTSETLSPDNSTQPTDEGQKALSPGAGESEADEASTATPEESPESTPEGKDAASLSFGNRKAKDEKDGKSGKEKNEKKANAAKLTPRQRRRRWLTNVLQPMKSLKCPITKLTSYQQLMLGRGRRSQLVNTSLVYDQSELVNVTRDVFVSAKHGLSSWFEEVVVDCLETSLVGKVEADVLAQNEETAQERLLESATEGLRAQFMRRPMRGHNIMLIDTIGPKDATIAIVNARGGVMTTDEIQCSAQPNVVNQNVIRLGELVHRHRVTLVAITNGPARRFLMASIKELMAQSKESGLRWTMADRSGAEAYASGRAALRELANYNHRHRAAIWIARALQDPLRELLKVDLNRLRLGSYQRELPQEPLKKLVRETIADCVAHVGIDTYHASVDELTCIPGVEEAQAQQITSLAAADELTSRSALLEKVQDWEERDSRQAIGFLRIYGGEQALDGTLIHPEDYRLAERLISNTELESPPLCPEGWSKPEKPDAASSEGSEKSESAEQGSSDPQATTPEVTTPDAAAEGGAEASVEEAALATEAPESNAEVAAEPAVATDTEVVEEEDAPAKEEASATPEDSSAPEESSDQSEDAAGADAEGASETKVETETTDTGAEKASAEDTKRPKPEYSEEVVFTPAVAPSLDIEKLARGWQVGREKLRWLATCLSNPNHDPRLNNTPAPMLSSMPELSTLEQDMCLWAVVVGVADFGAFVELGPDCSGLIHISRLSSSFVEDPHQILQVGDLVLVWVVSVDNKKNRVALTALSPEQREAARAQQEKERSERSDRKSHSRGQRSDGERGRGQGQRGSGQGDRRGDKPAGGKRRDSRDGSRGRSGGNRGRGDRNQKRSTKPVVVTSKKPKAPISNAMKEGDEPLRSFSDLMQFYESKRTDEPEAKAEEVKAEEVKVVENSVVEEVSEGATAGTTDSPVVEPAAAEEKTTDGVVEAEGNSEQPAATQESQPDS